MKGEEHGVPDRAPPQPHALLAGGGTGGHVFPALAVADELLARGWRVSMTGASGGLEERLAAARNLSFHGLAAKPLLGRGPLAKLAALATLARSAGGAARLVRRLGADVVLGTGGYVSAPAVLGARLARRPALLLEPNARAGVANRWLSRWAAAAAVGYERTAGDLRCPAVVTGVPVRQAFFAVPPLAVPAGEAGKAEVPGALQLLVLGGSQGAQQINQALPAAVALLLARLPGLRIVHQAGARHEEETRRAYGAYGADRADRNNRADQSAGLEVEVVAFLDDVASAMAASHLLLCRAGAITVAEICAAGRPAVLAPLAIAKGHQRDNARLLEEVGAAEVLAADELESGPGAAAALAARLAALLGDGARLARMGWAARQLARPRAAAEIADLLGRVGGAR
ncbi:MAG TPA: undecaprenyldiphospho-muramoylpentapeptide beta-N-acetylglucosaminyltransferase [Thermoanaerobaculia bacterium]|nr:undecaprenyldiphospho-muramoylpentapeptide beta-N-acetylglucosaminyltransferase [Thermoanaerobaculia bacterium]